MATRSKPSGEPGFFSRCTGGSGTLAGSYTIGTVFNVYAIGSIIWGMNFYIPYNVGTILTIKCSLWDPDGITRIGFDNVSIPANTPGFYQCEFTTKKTIAAADMDLQNSYGFMTSGHYMVTIWEASGSHYILSSQIAPSSVSVWGGGQCVTSKWGSSAWAAGDARPTNDSGVGYYVDPIVYGGLRSITPTA